MFFAKAALVLVAVSCLMLGTADAFAQEVVREIVTRENLGDFVVEPGKTEIELAPGESATRVASIANRTGSPVSFVVELEDFTGSDDPLTTVVLIPNEDGPYTLRNYLEPKIREFSLEAGERIRIPVTISVPLDAEPGGRYGAVIVSNRPSVTDAAAAQGGRARLVSRIGSLFLVRVKGEIKEEGQLEDFRISGERTFFEKGPVRFEILFRNSGNVHVTPFGTVTIKNLLGQTVGMAPVDAYFALPKSLRYRQIEWNKTPLFGRYTAELSLNRGYEDREDTAVLSFWVVPWKILVPSVIGVFLVIFGFLFIRRKFEIRLK